MTTFQISDTVGAIVRDHPALSRLFEQVQVDYCCGGQKTLAEACAKRIQIKDIFLALSAELATHLMKEEQILFPMIRQLEASDTLPSFHCDTVALRGLPLNGSDRRPS